ncbi:MAG: divergent polysaccharide deacetylase family protein [Deltaproteobacteria bacterium]|nr:divergent polysaccharide deacetylase family protein [Candidatus Anaeroferrophillus wilburensis]MBN2889344.1 divergent polysaccharide deacetylase family protein [Deltaproteobacteria bacterium]
MNKGSYRPHQFRFWLGIGTALLAIVLLVIFLVVARDHSQQPVAGKYPRESFSLPTGSRQVLVPVDALMRHYLPQGHVDRSSEWVSRGSHRWQLIRWQGVYGPTADMDLFLAACRKMVDQWPAGYDLLSYVDQHKTYFLLFLDRGELVGTLELHWQADQPRYAAVDQRPRIAIIIDDMGMNVEIARQLASISQPLTFSLFPYAPHTQEVADLLHETGKQLLLHVPMEPHGYPDVDPGPGALFGTMNTQELSSLFRAELDAVPGIVGFNNHMGSRLTENRQAMEVLMSCLRDKPLFFIDSRTSAATIAYDEACQAGIPAGQRDIFLDNIRDEEHILSQLEKLIAVAQVKKSAVGIGHPYPETVAALQKLGQLSRVAQVDVVPVGALMKTTVDH